jgi:hypothetical protein
LLAFGAWTYWAALAYPAGTLAQPGAGFVPRLLAVLLVLAAFGLLVHGGSPARLVDTELADFPITTLIVLLLAAATFALERTGYRTTMFAFLLLFLVAVERRPAWLSAILSGGFALGSFYLINDLLRVPLPLGRWGW